MSGEAGVRYTAAEALVRLQEGNERFLRGAARFPTVQKEILADLAKGQQPYATILGCSDSRVPPELVFDAGFGELFVIRLAGNILSPEVAGTIQYAGVHLKTPLFVVLGHEGCGAVQAALQTLRHGTRERSRIEALLHNVLPGLAGVDPELPWEEQMRRAVEANVRWAVKTILAMPEAQQRKVEGVLKLVGAVYDLTTGRVRFLEPADEG